MNFLSGSFQVGRLFGINIRVHILFVIWIGFILISAGSAWRTEALFWSMLFGIVLLHELGHCFGARSVGGDARDIMMWPLGGLAYAHAPMRPWPQFVTVAAGPLVNVVFCVASAALAWALTGGRVILPINPLGHVVLPALAPNWLLVLVIFYRVNLFLLAFNLLPIYPLDGGQLFHTILWPFMGLRRATLIACYVGIAGCVALGMLGLRGGGGILIFIALFGGITCYQRLKMARYGMLIEDDRFTVYRPTGRKGVWSRIFGRRGPSRRRRETPSPEGRSTVNLNPGGWEAKQSEQQRLEAELDRILKKVSERGIQSLSYVERQTLERVTRERQQRERDFQRENKL